jgi:hypothetical protein
MNLAFVFLTRGATFNFIVRLFFLGRVPRPVISLPEIEKSVGKFRKADWPPLTCRQSDARAGTSGALDAQLSTQRPRGMAPYRPLDALNSIICQPIYSRSLRGRAVWRLFGIKS